MKNKPTFREQYDKIVTAYMENELEPFNVCACFIGNMLNGSWMWKIARRFFDHGESVCFVDHPDANLCLLEQSGGLYTMEDIVKLENMFLKTLDYTLTPCMVDGQRTRERIYTEENLFKAMESTLQLLGEIHEAKGEIVEDYEFKKRNLFHESA